MYFNESIHFDRNSGDVGLGKKASNSLWVGVAWGQIFWSTNYDNYRCKGLLYWQFFFFQTRPVGHRFFAKQKQFLTCLSLKSYKATMDSRRRQGARLPKLTQGGCWCLWQHRPSNLHAAWCFSIPYLLDLHKLCKHNAVMYLKELTRELKGNKRSQDKKVSIAKENGDKL